MGVRVTFSEDIINSLVPFLGKATSLSVCLHLGMRIPEYFSHGNIPG